MKEVLYHQLPEKAHFFLGLRLDIAKKDSPEPLLPPAGQQLKVDGFGQGRRLKALVFQLGIIGAALRPDEMEELWLIMRIERQLVPGGLGDKNDAFRFWPWQRVVPVCIRLHHYFAIRNAYTFDAFVEIILLYIHPACYSRLLHFLIFRY